MVEVYGIKNPIKPSNVGLPDRKSVSSPMLSTCTKLTKSFGKVTTTRCRRLEKQSFVLLRAQLNGDLTTEAGTVANMVVLPHLVLRLVNVGHRRHGCRYNERELDDE